MLQGTNQILRYANRRFSSSDNPRGAPAVEPPLPPARQISRLQTRLFRSLTPDLAEVDILNGIVPATPLQRYNSEDKGQYTMTKGLLDGFSSSIETIERESGPAKEGFETSRKRKARIEEEASNEDEEILSSQDMVPWVLQAGFSDEALSGTKKRTEDRVLRGVEDSTTLAIQAVHSIAKQCYSHVKTALEEATKSKKAKIRHDSTDIDDALESITDIHAKAQAAIAQIGSYKVLVRKDRDD